MTNKIIGYARVSTIGQDYETQVEQLKAAGCEEIYSEKVTGTKRDRTELNRLLNDVTRAGDTVVITKIDRLARSIIDLNNIVNDFTGKGVTIRFLSENITFKPDNETSSMERLLFNMLGSFAQFERDLIVERTAEGRERARKAGKHLGRPARNKKDIERALKLYDEREENGHSVNDIAKLTGVPRSTIYHELQKRKNK